MRFLLLSFPIVALTNITQLSYHSCILWWNWQALILTTSLQSINSSCSLSSQRNLKEVHSHSAHGSKYISRSSSLSDMRVHYSHKGSFSCFCNRCIFHQILQMKMLLINWTLLAINIILNLMIKAIVKTLLSTLLRIPNPLPLTRRLSIIRTLVRTFGFQKGVVAILDRDSIAQNLLLVLLTDSAATNSVSKHSINAR